MTSSIAASRSITLSRRSLLGATAASLALAALPAGVTSARAQSLIQRPVKIIVPFSPGTGMDSLARIVGQQLQVRSGQPAVVENRVGASGNIGSQVVATAAPDGYTLMVTANTFVMTPPLYKNVPYDVVKDFTPIGMIALGQLVLAIHPSVKATTLQEFIALAKAQPGKIDYASPGNGTPQHLAMESFKLAAGINLNHIPYKGSGGAVQDLLGGTVGAMIMPVHTALPYLADNRVRVLGLTSAERSSMAPQIPTLAEQGVSGFEVDLWYGMYAPAKTPPDMVKHLNAELNQILADPAVRETIQKQGMVVRSGTPDALAQLTAKDLARWTKVINDAKIQPE
ncbi:tripartite tricarboxylate transporter substrate binding protein [Ferrovibrio terrae]|uniref:tripartite tricarboxylate transporter substrate binding protein n=1 Tax=Ferrovibrio terrae TaxID=2594003 RepID=UPI003137C19B